MRTNLMIACVAILALPGAAFADSINISGTGQAAVGSADPNYTVVAPMGAPSAHAPNATVINPNAGWGASIPGANWINASGDQNASDPGGDYLYTTTFDLTGEDASTAVLTGSFAADNSVVLYLNGVMTTFHNNYGTGPSTYGFNTVTPFTLNSGFVAGVNTLTFDVSNGNGETDTAGPTGLLANVSGTVAPAAVTPEPSSLVLLGTGAMGVVGAARRKFRS